jgi:hypothetical protein
MIANIYLAISIAYSNEQKNQQISGIYNKTLLHKQKGLVK